MSKGKRSGQQKGAQLHAEGQQGPKTHRGLVKQWESGPSEESAEARIEHQREVAALEGKRRLVEDRDQHDEAEKESEWTKQSIEKARGRSD